MSSRLSRTITPSTAQTSPSHSGQHNYLTISVEDRGLNVRDFGAIGDGATNDTTAISDALTAGAGGVVYIPNGTFLVNAALTVPADTTVIGGGAGSKIKLMTGATNHVFLVTGARARIANLYIDGNKASASGGGAAINLLAADCLVDAVYIKDSPSVLGAIRILDGAVRAMIRNCTLDACNGGIIADGNGVSVKQNDPHVIGCNIRSVTGQGISIQNAVLRARIMNNFIDTPSTIGIEAYNGSERAIIGQNTVISAGVTGISVGVSNKIVVEGNHIYSGPTYGIELAGSDCTVSGNVIEGSAEGITLPVSATVAPSHNVVSANRVISTTGAGIRIAGNTLVAKGNKFIENVITDPGSTAMQFDVDTDTELDNNTVRFTGTARNAISIASSNCAITNNKLYYDSTISSAAGIAINHAGGAKSKISGNIIVGNGKLLKGIASASATYCVIRDNHIFDTTQDLIRQDNGSATNRIDSNYGSTGAGSAIAIAAGVQFGKNYCNVFGEAAPITFNLAANTDNWNPANLDLAERIIITLTGNQELRGIAGGFEGRILVITNGDATDTLTLVNGAGTSDAAKRLSANANVAVLPGDTKTLVYSNSVWRITG